ncbi:MAG: FIST C-terminal domain-containing protein [Alphaproteobacteria bacterium]|nr:FIST C-terminal domain-containing protein [Alphaproteobacteria bacterium]
MKAYSTFIERALDAGTLEKIRAISPNFICLFFSPDKADSPVLRELCAAFKDVPVIGCSTAGEISDTKLSDSAISLMAVNFEKTTLRIAGEVIESAEACYEKSRVLAQRLQADDLAGVFILAPGLNVNGSAITRGFSSVLGSKVSISGGLAGDKTSFSQTYTLMNGAISENTIVVVGFYGEHIRIGTGSKGGWAPFGPARRITKADGNLLYQLDDKPALDLYKQYLGEKAEQLPYSGLLYPFSILEDDQSETGLIRTILDVNHESKSLILAGDMPEGKMVRLMHADVDQLIVGAENAAEEAHLDGMDAETSVALLVSCVGRKLVMADDVVEEVEAVQHVFGPGTRMAGFYSYGEICISDLTKEAELHNQTMTITLLSEAP